MIEAPFKPANTTVLVRDILETYHWEHWTTTRLVMEAARIRGCEITDSLKVTVGSAVRRLANSGAVHVGEETIVHYHDGGSQIAVSRTIRWKDAA
jgi:hypothetical protein